MTDTVSQYPLTPIVSVICSYNNCKHIGVSHVYTKYKCHSTCTSSKNNNEITVINTELSDLL